MKDQSSISHYSAARRKGTREYSVSISRGQSGYLPFLDGMLKNVDIVSEVSLGVVEIPLKKVVGTYTHARSNTFARNFMPLLSESTEFAQKWQNLCEIHINEGIRDPIKVYEYLNWFYVVEGNKRVSVLKYFDAYSISSNVTRLIPARNDRDCNVKTYYKFLDFYKETGINSIWFSDGQRFYELLDYLKGFKPVTSAFTNKYKYFNNSVYLLFRKVYLGMGGDKLSITTGDAFLEYIKVFGLNDKYSQTDYRAHLKKFLSELKQFAEDKRILVQTEPQPSREGSLFSTISSIVKPKKKLKVAFAYPGKIESSSWSYSHNWGRLHVENTMKEHVITTFVENVPEDITAYDYFEKLVDKGNDIIFATSPAFIKATLKAAMNFTDVKFLNCSQTHSFKHVSTYFGRIHEARFLVGMIAGAMTHSRIIGYVCTFPTSEVISGVNAFTLGAKMVNPSVKVKVAWIYNWDSGGKSGDVAEKLIQSGADIISHHTTLANRELCREFGVYSMVCNVDEKSCKARDYLASPVWNWGIFYEKIITTVLNGTLSSLANVGGTGAKQLNFWWGMDSGIVDVFYSKRLVPQQTAKLIDFMKKMIENNTYSPFSGPIYDCRNNLRVERDHIAGHDQILTMKWFVDGVEGEMPEMPDEVEEHELYTGMIVE